MDLCSWQNLYNNISSLTQNQIIVGFNVNLDRIITVTPALITSAFFNVPEFSELRSRLLNSMKTCTAAEWFVTDHQVYQQFVRTFAGSGSLVIGGQAGIAAVHLASMGISDVLCIVNNPGPETTCILKNAGVHLLDHTYSNSHCSDIVHLVFEYPPGLVPMDDGAIPRNNRFIASPMHSPESVLIPEDKENSFYEGISHYTRVFLSGYQYLQTYEQFQRAAEQIHLMKKNNDLMRIHVECVSVTDNAVIRGFINHILPVTDSIGLNEHELVLLLRCLDQNDLPEFIETLSPVQQVNGALEICKKSGLKRLHLHTFGYYVLVIRNDCAHAEISLNSLLFASRTVAEAAQGTHKEISSAGILAYEEIGKVFGPQIFPGIFRNNSHTIIMIPTIIAKGITKSSGLGDILSSCAFISDMF